MVMMVYWRKFVKSVNSLDINLFPNYASHLTANQNPTAEIQMTQSTKGLLNYYY